MFSNYFQEMPSPGVPLHNYILKDTLNRSKTIINASSSLNIIIFWASWCGPCRQEIPELKRIYSRFKKKGINMVSVSIDTNPQMWKLALLKESMEWEQLIVDSSLIDRVENGFNFAAIPLIIFTNNKGLEIARFTGYDPAEKDKYSPIIEKYLEKFQD